MTDRFTIGLVLIGAAIFGYAVFSPRSDDHSEAPKKDPSIKAETNPNAVLPEILQKLDNQVQVRDGFIVVMEEPGLDTFLLPLSSAWLVRCGAGASISMGSTSAGGPEGPVQSEVDVSLSYDLIDKGACSVVAPRIAARLQEKLAGK